MKNERPKGRSPRRAPETLQHPSNQIGAYLPSYLLGRTEAPQFMKMPQGVKGIKPSPTLYGGKKEGVRCRAR